MATVIASLAKLVLMYLAAARTVGLVEISAIIYMFFLASGSSCAFFSPSGLVSADVVAHLRFFVSSHVSSFLPEAGHFGCSRVVETDSSRPPSRDLPVEEAFEPRRHSRGGLLVEEAF